MRRGALSVAVLVAAASGLAGCSVPLNGLVGVSVDAQGDLLAVVAVCSDDPPDVVYLSGFRTAAGPSPSPTVEHLVEVQYEAPPQVGRSTSFRLDAPGNGWVAHPGPPQLLPDVDYSLYGRTHDNSSSTKTGEFRLSDRDLLSPGMVLIQETRDGVESDLVVSQADFESRAATFC